MAEINITNAKTDWAGSLFYGILMIVMGIVLIIFKAEALKWILIISGIMSVVFGIAEIIVVMKKTSNFPVMSLLGVILGVIMIILPNLVADVLMILLGIAFILYGAINVVEGLTHDAPAILRIMSIVVGVMGIAVGIFAFVNLNNTANVIMIVTGAFAVATGIIQVMGGLGLFKGIQ